MSTPESAAWVHIGECPVCVDGICRIRVCCGKDGQPHLLAICVECEAIWVRPDTSSRRIFPDATNAECPICKQPLYGPQSHWAVESEVSQDHDWSLAAIVESNDPSDLDAVAAVPDNSDDLDLLSVEDIAADLDAPALIADPKDEITACSPHPQTAANADDAYGQDEPKPGC